jgi:hypothetical protein
MSGGSKDLLAKLGVKLDENGHIGCQASDEVHAICDFLIDQIALSLEWLEEAEDDGDQLAVAAARLQQDVLVRAAMAIHSGAHLDYMGD